MDFQFGSNRKGSCRKCDKPTEADELMVSCDDCDRWFHTKCVGLARAPRVDESWKCAKCLAFQAMLNKKDAMIRSLQEKLTNEEKKNEGAGISAQQLDLNESFQLRAFEAIIDKIQNINISQSSSNSFAMRQSIMKLPEFDGSYKVWPRFKQAFYETTRMGNFSDLENVNRLNECLKGEALKISNSLLMNSGNIHEIMANLEDQFGSVERVYSGLLNDVLSLRNPKFENPQSMIDFISGIGDLVINMECLNHPEYLNDQRLVRDLANKLPASLHQKWLMNLNEEKILSCGENPYVAPTIKTFYDWLKPQQKLATMLLAEKGANNEKPVKRFDRVNHHNAYSAKCMLCGQNHKLIECNNFKKMSPENRRQFATEKKLCFSCCHVNHMTRNCKYARVCNIDGCKSKHNRLLHAKSADNKNAVSESSQDKPDTVNCHVKNQNKVYYQIVPVTLINGNKNVKTYAFFDSGSSVSLINAETAENLQATGVHKPMTLAWTNGDTQEDSGSMSIKLDIKAFNGKVFKLRDLRTIKGLSLPTQSVDMDCLKKRFPYLEQSELTSYENAVPTLLLGLPHAYLFKGSQDLSRKFNEPIARMTKLGWVLFGSNQNDHNTKEHVFVIEETMEEEKSIKEMMSSYFSIDSFGVKVPTEELVSKADERALDIMSKTLKPTEKGYEIGLLWKNDIVELPNSFRTALNRFLLLEKKVDKDQSLKEWYNGKIDEYVEKGYLKKLSPQESVVETARTFYLPHFVIENKNKQPPKRRMVFDAAAKINGVSLNSQLLSGPDMTESSLGIKMRFREGSIAVSGDIQEMFHQVGIRKEDRNSQRIVSRKNSNDRLDVYEMQVMTFGATCSPACAQYVKNTNAKRFINEYPEAVEAIIRNHYVDDYLDSFNELDKATKIVLDVIKIHDQAHFKMRNFISNSKSLLKQLPEDRVSPLKEIKLDIEENVYEKVLGMYWDTVNDKYKFKVIIKADEWQNPTKRQLLSFVMSIYDPLGLIAHITIQSKIIMQDLWRIGTGWDDQVPEKVKSDWQDWIKRLSTLDSLRIPRCYSYAKNIIRRELHVFGDASANAFAAVIYLRTIHDKGIDVTIVAGKSKVAPTKIMSIPRLELQAAVLGTRLSDTVQKELRLELNQVTYWSDSKTVLSWIKSELRKYKQFVQHRVSEILDSTVESQWRYIDTATNPADEGTKVILTNSKWIDGPDFLRTYDSYWQIGEKNKNSQDLSHEELRPMFTIAAVDKPNFDWLNIEWCSDWNRLKRSVCVILKYANWLKCKVTNTKFDKIITATDMEKAENILIQKAQWEAFPDELVDLKVRKFVEKSSRIRTLSPFLSEDGTMRSDTRYKNAECVPYGARRPYILPEKHHISNLILKNQHELFKHKKTQAAVAAVQQKYHIIHINAAMKKMRNRCQHCKNERAKACAPRMAPLPECRLQPYVKPFTHTGVDYFGPYNVSIGRRTEKRWGVVFTCMTTRAVYLELAHDLSADAFLICLNSVQNRRGKIKFLYSDNGTNFIGANNEMSKIRHRLTSDGIEWQFNPPLSPHFGGAWERMVKEVKSLLPSETMPEYTLRALLTEIEFIINCRPLTFISIDETDDEPLTPNHFLIGCAGGAEPSLNDVTKNEASRQQWKKVQFLAKNYWDRWLHEYLPTQAKRSKWTDAIKNVKVGDIVLIADDNQKAKWQKGIILKTHIGKDGQVRSAVVKTANGEYTRPVVKLAVLDVESNEEKPNLKRVSDPANENEIVEKKGNFVGIVQEIYKIQHYN